MTRHTVKLHGVAVGYSDLEDADATLGRARGRFRPGVGYDLVQPIFRLFAEAVPSPGADVADQDKLDRYHRSRDALGLSLEDDSGRQIRTSAIHISDYSDNGGGSIEVEVLISDPVYWQRRSGHR
ncbi:MAG TPA: hypothetical protein VJ867_16400 [Gemmatimonadaceae bacterium]|nr:hypothetical protein [Gemmatimonadaceae bacterium]